MPPLPRHRWLWPSRHDPWNSVFARCAKFLALLQWVVMGWWLIDVSSSTYTHPVTQCLMAGVVTLLGLIGYRGLVSGHANPLGSFILLAANGFLLAVQLLAHLDYLSSNYSR
ncbi:hypothetical protein WJU23_21605 [Prosthecobacter sp. SYSU 5D2]|uniref:hypothetical protein n=1 Tax=Prosthecobacter sp. SYSU 5D2 TaxID=3134134 RepID=UPI0031FEEEE5